MDVTLLRESFAALAPRAGELTEYFYGHLFATGGPEVIDIFPPDMSYVRMHLAEAIGQAVTNVDKPEVLAPLLRQLGRTHRKFGIEPRHFEMVGASLLAALARFAGDAWTPELKATWAEAYGVVSGLMMEGLSEDAQAGNPPWWDAVVTGKEMRRYDIVILSARLQQPMTWRPGQSVSVQLEGGPPIWRNLTPANAPRAAQTLEFHVKVVPGGMMSVGLAVHAQPGTMLKVGPVIGTLALDEDSPRDIVMIAGSTGLSAMLAMLEALSLRERPPQVALYFGARTPGGLYDLDRLEKMAGERNWLTVRHAVLDPEPGYEGLRGSIVDVAAGDGPWEGRDAYVCGPSEMVRAAHARLVALGMPRDRVHVENFGWEG
jgi:NAD(P)H-flavin reductase/hemoglobin-like flavoprotein